MYCANSNNCLQKHIFHTHHTAFQIWLIYLWLDFYSIYMPHSAPCCMVVCITTFFKLKGSYQIFLKLNDHIKIVKKIHL